MPHKYLECLFDYRMLKLKANVFDFDIRNLSQVSHKFGIGTHYAKIAIIL
jgi:hypothetical protein